VTIDRARRDEVCAACEPDSGIERSYGEQWPPPCLDYWVYVDPETRQARLSVEGWGTPDQTLGLRGVASVDGRLLSTAFAAVLRMPHPDHT
jgi:hypothetical protein